MLLGFTTSLIFLKLFAKYFCSRFLSLCLGLCLCLSVSVDLIKYVIFFNSRLEPASSICVEFVRKLIGHSTFSECQIIDPEKCSYVMPFRFNWNILLWLIHSFNFVVVYFCCLISLPHRWISSISAFLSLHQEMFSSWKIDIKNECRRREKFIFYYHKLNFWCMN